jgi:hypothetical protein
MAGFHARAKKLMEAGPHGSFVSLRLGPLLRATVEVSRYSATVEMFSPERGRPALPDAEAAVRMALQGRVNRTLAALLGLTGLKPWVLSAETTEKVRARLVVLALADKQSFFMSRDEKRVLVQLTDAFVRLLRKLDDVSRSLSPRGYGG